MTDWGGSHDPVAAVYSGNDLIEPGGSPSNIITSFKKVAPTIDLDGLPVYNKVTETDIRIDSVAPKVTVTVSKAGYDAVSRTSAPVTIR